MRRHWQAGLVLLVVVAPLLALIVAVPPIGQDPRYDRFADQRTLCGLPNTLNVLSNAPLLVVGLLGLRQVRRRPFLGPRAAWATHFAGTALVCFGSMYFHWAPDDPSLVWDRLPMTGAFMGFFVTLLTEHVGRHVASAWLVPAVLIGVGSVLWWAYAGDLRVYVWVQGGPLVAIPVLLLCGTGRFTHGATCSTAWGATSWPSSQNSWTGRSSTSAPSRSAAIR